ncbi:MAG: alanine dehydrogenase [Bacteroidales bacterium]|nr:alanine dehydrogenase [Bacteroidales bacterium]
MEENQSKYFNISRSGLMPKEEMLDVRTKSSSLVVGIPKEICFYENRVAIVPEAVNMLVENGYRVVIEENAGLGACFTDTEYAEAGGEIVGTAKEVFQQADIIAKVSPLSMPEIEFVKKGQTIISALHISAQTPEYFRKLSEKKVIALAFEFIRDSFNSFPLVRAVSEIAGNTSILLAAQYLADTSYGKGNMLGGFSGITPTEVVIIGSGTVGEFAARAALGLGAMVKVFDNNLFKLRRLQTSVNSRIFTSVIQPKVLLKSLRTAHVVIGALRNHTGRTPIVVSEDMVRQMKKGAVIIDVSIDQGGCFETSKVTSHANPTFQAYGVTHYCVPNIAARVPHTASYALCNYLGHTVLEICEYGGVENMIKQDNGLRKGVYLYKGALTNQVIGEMYNIPYQDIDLITSSWL